jgi:hypothetical protein
MWNMPTEDHLFNRCRNYHFVTLNLVQGLVAI